MALAHLVAMTMAGLGIPDNWPSERPKAEVVFSKAGEPGIRISWQRDLFFRGNQTSQWLVYRDDVGLATPIGRVGPRQTSFVDTTAARKVDYISNMNEIKDFRCRPLTHASLVQPGLTVGRPHKYYVASVYKIKGVDLPDIFLRYGPVMEESYFRTECADTGSTATALTRPKLLSPIAGGTVSDFPSFQFTSVGVPAYPLDIAYVLQISSSESFEKGTVFSTGEEIFYGSKRERMGLVARFPGDTIEDFVAHMIGNKARNGKVWWRIGARSLSDQPDFRGLPVKGARFIYSEAQYFKVSPSVGSASHRREARGMPWLQSCEGLNTTRVEAGSNKP